MGTHLYDNPGPKETVTRTSIGGLTIPAETHVRLWDGTDHVQLSYTDLDALDETCRMYQEARAAHIAALLEGNSEQVRADVLGEDDLAVIDGELVMVCRSVLTDTHCTILFARKYEGLYDLPADRSIVVLRSTMVTRLLANVPLTVVQ
jgi:hypothetical protein